MDKPLIATASIHINAPLAGLPDTPERYHAHAETNWGMMLTNLKQVLET